MDLIFAGRIRRLSAALMSATALLSACGGGGGGAEDPAQSSAQAVIARSGTTGDVTSRTTPVVAVPAPSAAVTPTLTIRAHANLAAQIGPIMELRIDGQVVGRLEVRSTVPTDHTVQAPGLRAGSQVDLAFVNNEAINGEDRDLFIAYLSDGQVFATPGDAGVVFDAGTGAQAFDGQNTSPGMESLWGNGALRMIWPAASAGRATDAELAASRLLQQASFGPTLAEVARVQTMGVEAWINEQLAMPVQPTYVAHIQSKFDQGPQYLPYTGALYTPDWVAQRFWLQAATAPDQLRKRMAWALQNIFVASQAEANLFQLARPYAGYLDHIDRLALGNYRELLEEVALSPVMGVYLSHLRNAKEDPARHRLPDENFARELMQLFTIGLHELNDDGTPRLDAQGRPIETYSNSDVMAMARVFTGWSWGYDDAQLTEQNFLYGTPDPSTRGAARVDLRRMKPYPGQWSTGEKRLFSGRAHAVVITAGTHPHDAVKTVLDTLFAHPNVGPFISRQLIQRLVTSHPSPAYVQRVARVFNDNGRGVRGDLGAVARAILLDPEARQPASTGFGKIREPVLRVAHWMRSFEARSSSGQFLVTPDLQDLQQRALHMPSVFGYFRPGYVPPASLGVQAGVTAPELQIVDESSVAHWVNLVEVLLREGLGWHGTNRDVIADLGPLTALVNQSPNSVIGRLELLLLGRPMSPALRKDLMDAMQGVPDSSPVRDRQRAQVAIFLTLSSPEYLLQR